MTETLRRWAAVENDIVVHGGFQAPQSYIDSYIEQVLDREDRTTPDWYNENVTFLDVTDLDPSPTTNWYKNSDGSWTDGNPSLTADRSSISADGVTSATVVFKQTGSKAPSSVDFDVNGETITENLGSNGTASIEVTSNNSGDTVIVRVGVDSVTINVVD